MPSVTLHPSVPSKKQTHFFVLYVLSETELFNILKYSLLLDFFSEEKEMREIKHYQQNMF